jgi:hypothetical protein
MRQVVAARLRKKKPDALKRQASRPTAMTE